MEVKLYLVGDENSNKTNSWLFVSNGLEEASAFARTLPISQIKIITIKENYR